ncbi:hypothetical protein NC651_023303 [Populus alba x Populus x berolinensis]|nr:hypothetical protein NC651_023303 [Populus alba x Populus x berolinensis]
MVCIWSGNIFLKGRQLTVLKALDKKQRMIKEKDILTPHVIMLYELLPSGFAGREDDQALRTPNFHVSRTRLVVTILTKLSQRTISRGVAFVEFTEHQHALVALRVLNNNPETFGPEHRPIVSFALDNVQTLKLRKAKLHETHKDFQDTHVNDESQTPNAIPSQKEMSRKRKSRVENRAVKDPESHRMDEVKNKDSYRTVLKSRRAIQELKTIQTSAKDKRESWKQKAKGSQHKQKDEGRKSDGGNSVNSEKIVKPFKEADLWLAKRKRPTKQKKTRAVRVQRKEKRPKKNKDPVGQDVADKLDMLIEQYKSKFSKQTADKPEDLESSLGLFWIMTTGMVQGDNNIERNYAKLVSLTMTSANVGNYNWACRPILMHRKEMIPRPRTWGSMEKGRVWVSGHRYCTVCAKGNCTGCSYSATLRPARCQLGCGQPPRKW